MTSNGQIAAVRWLAVILLLEMIVGGTLLGWRLARPAPPLPDFSSLDRRTADDLRQLREQVLDGTYVEWRALGQAYLGYGFYPEAEQCLHQAVRLQPEDLEAVYGLAFCLERVGKSEEAIPVLKRAAALADETLARTCWYSMGLCYLRQENAVEAEAAFRRVADFPPAVYHLGRLLVRTGRPEEGASLLDAHLERLPNSLKLLQARAQAADALDEKDLARTFRDREERAQYQIALQYGTRYISLFRARYGLARDMVRCRQVLAEGTLDDRQRCLQELVGYVDEHRLPQYQKLLVSAAEIELELQQPESALALLRAAEEGGYRSAATVELRGEAWQQKGGATQAAELWETALQLGPSVELYQKLASWARENGGRAEADRYDALRHQREGMEHYRSNEPDQSRRHLQRSLKLAPVDARTWYYLGAVHRVTGEISKAREAYARCLELDADYQRARVELGWMTDEEEERSETR